MKTHIRMIAAIMALMMLLSALPIITFAQEQEITANPERPATETGIDNAKIINENTARRSEKEKHFKLSDGTFLAVQYAYPVHTQNEAGEWEDMDLSFTAEASDDIVTYTNKTDALAAAISGGTAMQLAADGDANPISLMLMGFDMDLTEEAFDALGDQTKSESAYLENIKVIEKAVKSSALCFADPSKNVTLSYERTYSSIRQNIVFTEELEDGNLSFALETGDLTAMLNDSGNVEIKAGDEIKYILPAPYMYNSAHKNFSFLSYALEETEDGGYILTINADSELLNREDASYPLTISAAVIVPYKKASNLTVVSSETPDMSYTGENSLVGRIAGGNITRAFFDTQELPALTEEDIMLSAQMHAAPYYFHTEEMALLLEAYSVDEEWDAESITWNNQPAYFGAAKECTVHEKDSVFVLSEWDMTKEVRDRYDGAASHGIVLGSSDETAAGAAFVGEISPYLLVNYVRVSRNPKEESSTSEDITERDAADNMHDTIAMDNAATSHAATKTFDEITDELDVQYYSNDKQDFCGVRINTNSSNFYLKYKSMNAGNRSWLGYVYSTKLGENDYAGILDKPMTQLAIEVYTAGGMRIFDDYVVMYRAKVPDRGWLNWVSNGDSEVMHTIQSEYPDEITGGLDTGYYSNFAGWAPYGNIQALEIRMFKRVGSGSSGGSSAPVEAGDFQLASGITMKYRQTGTDTWTAFGVNDTVSFSDIDGIMLETAGKPYYFRYAAKDKTTGWNPYVSSRDANVNDHKNGYAGYGGRPITNVAIEVHTASGRVYDDYIVIYRAKAGGKWLPWVSNGWPDIMETLMPDAELDTKSTNAGDGRYGSIQALEIRVYERKGLNPTPGANAKIIDVPYINQHAIGMPNGCESVSTVMALQHIGVNISPDTFVDKYLDMGSVPYWKNGVRYGFDPNKVFGGNPRLASGWGCFAPAIMKALNKFSDSYGFTAENVSGKSLEYLCTNYIDKGIPVVLWGTVGMTSSYKIHNWTTPDGASVSYNNKLHCLVLTGYDENNYFFNDPMSKKTQGYSRASVDAAYAALGKQAVIITKGSSSSGGQTVAPPKNETVKDPVEIPKTPSLPDEKVQDPIDLSTGAHVIDHTLMTVLGAQTLHFDISYRSNVLTEGSAGRGWSHNFEKRIADDGDALYIYDSPAYYAVYKKTASDANVFKSDTVTKQNYTATRIPDGQNTSYVVNCNDQFTEYYDFHGRLTKITGKSGLNTLVTYPDDNTVKITDEISGRYMQITKNSDGKITSVTDNSGRTCTLGYIDGNLVSITDENGEMLSYQYNEKGQIECGRDQNGIIYFTDTYDSAGRVIRQKDAIADSAETVISYDDATDPDYLLVSVTDRTMQTTVYKYNDKKQLVSKTDPNGVEIQYAYDSHGNLTKKTDGLGNSVVNVYDARENLISSTDKRGQKTEYTYDAKNNLTMVKYPGGGTVTKTYNSKNLLTSSTDLRGTATTYEYNNQNLLTKASCAGRTITYAYTKGQPTAVTDTLGRTTTKVYNDAGFLMSITDAQDNTTSYTYDNKGNVLTVTDPDGSVSSKEYDAGGSLVKSTDANGNATSYTYNGNLKMTSMTLPVGVTILYEYDGEDRLVKTVYPDGTEAVNTYDAGGRTIRQTDRDGNTTTYEYDAANNVVQITDPIGGVTKKAYDEAGNLIKNTQRIDAYDPYLRPIPEKFKENHTTYTYDAEGRLTNMENPAGGTTVYTYNTAGDLLSVTDPVGNTTQNTYDAFGNLLTVTDPRGYTTAYTYDAADNLLTVTDALGQITTNTYDSLNRLISTQDPGGHTISYAYDALGRLTARTDAKGNTVRQYYDAMGNIVKITNASNHIDFEAVYDAAGRATEVTNAAREKTTNVYDWSGNLIQQTDALQQSSFYTYNGAGQMINAVDKAGGESFATYDGIGNCTSMNGPGGAQREYSYNSAGLRYERECFVDSKEKTVYNELGLKATVRDPINVFRNYKYDAAGRLIEDSGSGEYTYDENGNITEGTNSSGTVKREYDGLNRVTKYTDIYGQTVEYEYDCCGNLIKMTYPTGETAVYTYDENHNMLTSGMENRECATTYEYDKQNQITKISRPDGSVTAKNYDSSGRLSTFTDKDKNGQYITSGTFGYDSLGRIRDEICVAQNLRYAMEYDALGRLTKRTEYNLRTNEVNNVETYSYDAAGNILEAETGAGKDTYAYGKDNQLVEWNGKDYGISAKGNTTRHMHEGEIVYVDYDRKDRIKKIGGDLNEYWYDADDNRINMYYYHTNMKYFYDSSGGRHQLLWTSSHLEEVSIYGYGADGLLWSECDGEYQIYHYDYRGSVVAVTDMDGNITDTVKYDAYGSVTERTGDSKLIFGYNGQYGVLTDPNGLLYMRTRYYNPALKRFMKADILEGSIADSTSMNVFAYANGNPISFVDPFGLSAERGNNDGFFSNLWSNICDKASGAYNWTADKVSGAYNWTADKVSGAFNWTVDEFKKLTKEGKLDLLIKLGIGASKDEKGIYHIDNDWWQSFSIVGYNDIYDWAFDLGTKSTGTSMDFRKFEFTAGDEATQYIIWLWKGDYINLGAGAEAGIYRESIIPGHWLTDKADAMKMTLSLSYTNGQKIYDYSPDENLWWITGFDPSNQTVQAADLIATVTIDFTGKDKLFEGFYAKYGETQKPVWSFDGKKATIIW